MFTLIFISMVFFIIPFLLFGYMSYLILKGAIGWIFSGFFVGLIEVLILAMLLGSVLGWF